MYDKMVDEKTKTKLKPSLPLTAIETNVTPMRDLNKLNTKLSNEFSSEFHNNKRSLRSRLILGNN